jgi:TrmH family RNA methyltransferase
LEGSTLKSSGNESIVVTSVRNRRVVEARKLRQRKHRQRQGRFLVDDSSILQMALGAGAQPVEVFYCESQLAELEAVALLEIGRQTDAKMMAVSPKVMGTLCERDTPQGIVAAFSLFEVSLQSLRVSGSSLVVVLDRLQDPGNLGTLIRTSDAVGAAAVILIEPCVDPFDPKTVRGTMGSLFNVPLVRTSDVSVLFDWFQKNGLCVVGTDAERGEIWGDKLWAGGMALVLGNEARGLSNDVRPFVEAWARLPIVGKAESLNVAVAGGVLMYAWLWANLREQGSSQEHAASTQQNVSQDY